MRIGRAATSSPLRLRTAFVACVAIAITATAADPAHAADDKPEPLPTALSVVPGLLVHGSGHFAAGDSDTGWRLLAWQGMGLGASAVGFGGLAATGAARQTAGLFVAVGFARLFPFTASWLADVVGTARRGERMAFAEAPGAGLQPVGARLRLSAGPLLDAYEGVGAVTRLQVHVRQADFFVAPRVLMPGFAAGLLVDRGSHTLVEASIEVEL